MWFKFVIGGSDHCSVCLIMRSNAVTVVCASKTRNKRSAGVSLILESHSSIVLEHRNGFPGSPPHSKELLEFRRSRNVQNHLPVYSV